MVVKGSDPGLRWSWFPLSLCLFLGRYSFVLVLNLLNLNCTMREIIVPIQKLLFLLLLSENSKLRLPFLCIPSFWRWKQKWLILNITLHFFHKWTSPWSPGFSPPGTCSLYLCKVFISFLLINFLITITLKEKVTGRSANASLSKFPFLQEAFQIKREQELGNF